MVRECNEEIAEVRSIDVLMPEEVIFEYINYDLNFISLDVEGLEKEILGAFPFEKIRPEVFCIETLSYSTTGRGVKSDDLVGLMQENEYSLYADTYINSIFIEKNRYKGVIK